MNQSIYEPIYICILKEYLKTIIGEHYPIEIIELIIMADYQPIKINCGWYHTTLISDKTYIWGNNDYGPRVSSFGRNLGIPGVSVTRHPGIN